jgi:hypothetical protein
MEGLHEACDSDFLIRIVVRTYENVYSGTSVDELNSFLEAVREPKCS